MVKRSVLLLAVPLVAVSVLGACGSDTASSADFGDFVAFRACASST